MTVKNKWNHKIYTVVENKGKTVVLEREDGSQFEISIKEFKEIYYENN